MNKNVYTDVDTKQCSTYSFERNPRIWRTNEIRISDC